MSTMSAAVSNEEVQCNICKRYEELVLEIGAAEDHLGKLRGKATKLFDEMVRLSNRYTDEMRRMKINEALKEHENESKERPKAGRRNGAHHLSPEIERSLQHVPDVYAAARAPEQTTFSGIDRPTGERQDEGDAGPDQESLRPA
jgi:hypothetical protein